MSDYPNDARFAAEESLKRWLQFTPMRCPACGWTGPRYLCNATTDLFFVVADTCPVCEQDCEAVL